MKNLLITLAALFALHVNPLNAQIIQGSFEGTELACLSSTKTYSFWWSDTATVTNETINYSIKTRSGGAINSSDVAKSENNGALTLVIDKNHFDIIITMTVKIGLATKKFTKRVQVGLGDPLNIDMIEVSETAVRCRDNTTQITLSVDKEYVYGVDFLWTFPTGWVQTVGDASSNYIKVRPDGIHTGSITCQMKVYGDQFCEGDEAGNYLGPIVSIDYLDLLPPTIGRGQPSDENATLTYNSTTPIRFVVSSKSGATYTWSLPCGWQGPNGQTGSFTSTTSYVDITPSGYTGPGEQVKVVANMDCAGTPKNSNYVTWGFVWGGSSASISGNSTLCTSNQTYTLATPAGTTVSWSASPISLFAVFTGSGSSFTTRARSSSSAGAGTISATISGSCGNYTKRKNVWVGKPQDVLGRDDIAGPDCIIAEIPAYYHGLPWPTSVPGADSYEASIQVGNPTGISMISSTNRVEVKVLTNSSTPVGSRVMEIAPKNACGYGSATYAFFDVQNSPRDCGGIGGPRLSVSPNPADSYIDIELSNKNVKTNTQLPVSNYTGETENVEITILNDKNIPVYNKLMPGKKLQINTQNLPNGFYYLRVKSGEQVYSRQIVVKH